MKWCAVRPHPDLKYVHTDLFRCRLADPASHRAQGKWALCPRHIVGLGACGEEPTFVRAEPTTFRSQYSNPLLIRYTGRPETSSGIRRITMNTPAALPCGLYSTLSPTSKIMVTSSVNQIERIITPPRLNGPSGTRQFPRLGSQVNGSASMILH